MNYGSASTTYQELPALWASSYKEDNSKLLLIMMVTNFCSSTNITVKYSCFTITLMNKCINWEFQGQTSLHTLMACKEMNLRHSWDTHKLPIPWVPRDFKLSWGQSYNPAYDCHGKTSSSSISIAFILYCTPTSGWGLQCSSNAFVGIKLDLSRTCLWHTTHKEAQ